MSKDFQTPSRLTKRGESSSCKLLAIPPSPFLEKLGYGTGVTVWKLQRSPKSKFLQSPWAIKNVRRDVNKQLTSKYQSLLNKEAKILKTLQHDNIVGFRGYLKSEDGRDCLAMEVGGESLGNLIESRYEDNLGPYPAETILKVARDVAKALKYLHEEKRILHGDLKSYNIVVKDDFKQIKLCDFGVSISLDDSNLKEKFIGTPIYSAPECQSGAEGLITAKSDVFSLGLVLWEMISLFPPHTEDLLNCKSFADDESNSSESLSSEEDISNELQENYGTRPPLPPVELGPEYEPVLAMFYVCTEQNPENRPSAAELVDWLETLVKA